MRRHMHTSFDEVPGSQRVLQDAIPGCWKENLWPGRSRVTICAPDALRCKCGIVAFQVIVNVQLMEFSVLAVMVVSDVPN